MAANAEIVVPVVGEAGLPDSGIDAVVLNVTATEGTGPGFVTRGTPHTPDRELDQREHRRRDRAEPRDRPGRRHRSDPTVALGGHDLLGDVLGYVTDSSAASSRTGLFVPLSPDRVLTRANEPAPGPKGQIPAGASITPVIVGEAGIPADVVAYCSTSR